MLLCKFKGQAAEPHDRAHYVDLVVARGTSGLNDYWIDNSMSAIDLDGSQVFDWRALTKTKDEYGDARPTRWDKVQGAIEAHGITASDWFGVIAVFNVHPGDGGRAGMGVLAGPDDTSVTWLGHETGHVLGFGHSFDQSDRQLETWSQKGEYYDTFDVMSAMNVAWFDGGRFGAAGPNLAAPHRQRAGWLPEGRIWTPPAGQSSVTEVQLAPLSKPDMPGFLAARIGELYVEYRTATGWDQGFQATFDSGVLIHWMGSAPNPVVQTSDPARFINFWPVGRTYGPPELELAIQGGTRITVVRFDSGRAVIRVHHSIARPEVAGPALQLPGGAGSDGGGLVIIGGRPVRIPPWTPLIAILGVILTVIAGAVLAGAGEGGHSPASLATGLLLGLAGLVSTAVGALAIGARLPRR